MNNPNEEISKEDESLYNAIIIALIIGIIIVLITLYFFRPEEEKFTELYFLNHESLGNYSSSNVYNFSFAIHNLEGKRKEYIYEIKFDDKIIKSKNVFVNYNKTMIINESVSLNTENRTKIEVNLLNQDQSIHFWTEEAIKHEFVSNEGREDSSIECVPFNMFKRGDPIFVKVKGSYSEGSPIMQVWINGKKDMQFNVSKQWETRFVSAAIRDNARIDLAFINDYGIKSNETNKYLSNRDIYVDFVGTRDKTLDYIYDKGKWDCEDLKPKNAMAWNGALRLRVVV